MLELMSYLLFHSSLYLFHFMIWVQFFISFHFVLNVFRLGFSPLRLFLSLPQPSPSFAPLSP
jgi:hypothetical protein